MTQIDVLPDDALLRIFDFYSNSHPPFGSKKEMEAWKLLVQVCRRWRSLVLGSPGHLNLQLFCTPKTPAKEPLEIWPTLPLLIRGSMISSFNNMDGLIAALGQSNRVRQIALAGFERWELEEVLAAMQVPYPELTDLQLWADEELSELSIAGITPIPDSFLGGSAPRLRRLTLIGIPFPGLPRLQFSANHLAELRLENIPHSGYISPEAMAALISVLSSLRSLVLQFKSPESRPNRETRSPPPPERSILPSLEYFRFKGVVEYLEDLLAFIDAPQIISFQITFFDQINLNCPRLVQFIKCTPILRATEEAHVQFDDSTAIVELRYRTSTSIPFCLSIDIPCEEEDLQLSFIERVCNSSLRTIFTVEDLYIEHHYSEPVWWNDTIENTLWLQLLLPFTPVKDLYLSKDFAPGIAKALRGLVGDRITEVLPNLQNIFVQELEPSGAFQENIGQFVIARQLSGHPIAISVWDKIYPGNMR